MAVRGQSPGRRGTRCKGPEAALCPECRRGEGAGAGSEESLGVGIGDLVGSWYSHWVSVKLVCFL